MHKTIPVSPGHRVRPLDKTEEPLPLNIPTGYVLVSRVLAALTTRALVKKADNAAVGHRVILSSHNNTHGSKLH